MALCQNPQMILNLNPNGLHALRSVGRGRCELCMGIRSASRFERWEYLGLSLIGKRNFKLFHSFTSIELSDQSIPGVGWPGRSAGVKG